MAPADREGLRIFVILPLSGLFENPKLFTELHCPFGSSFIYLPENASTTLEKWISRQSADYLRPFIANFKVC